MKKINSKNLLKFFILIFSISLILSNCNREDQTIVDESQLEKTTPLILNQKIPFNQAQHFNQLESKINKIKDKINGHNSQSKTGNEDIIILTNEVLYITYASTHTYSFKILREQPQAFIENIVLHYNIETEDYDEYLVQYHIPAEQFVSIHEGDLLQNSDNVTITSLENGFFENNSQAKSCNRVCVTINVDCSSGIHNGGNVSSWGECSADEPPAAYQSCSSVCDNDNEITGPGSSVGGNSGGGNTTVVSNPLPTEPCESDTTDGIGITGSNGECITLVQIINNLTGMAKCVFEKLLTQNGNLFRSTIGKFIDNPDYHLQLNSGGQCNSPSDDACTDGSSIASGLAIINIINEGQGTLDLAALILHEGIHAEIYKYVNEYNQGLDPQNRENLLGYYFIYQAENGNDLSTSNAQHQHMADNFVKPIAEALRQLDNYKYPLNDYMGFAWDGLRKYGWDGYYDNGEYVTLDRSTYASVNQTVLDNTEFNNDCN